MNRKSNYRRSVRGSGAEPPREDVTGEELTVAELVRGLYDISQEAVENCNPLVARVAAWGAKRLEEKTAVVDPLEELLNLAERVAELEAVVAKLPKTADGVPVTPGMTVWKRCLGQPCSSVVQIRRGKLGGVYSDFDRCYSTREAAEAANRMAHEVARYIEDKEMPT